MLRKCAGGENGTPAAEVLLVRRAKAPAIGMWTVPGGSLELGEQQQMSFRTCVVAGRCVQGISIYFIG